MKRKGKLWGMDPIFILTERANRDSKRAPGNSILRFRGTPKFCAAILGKGPLTLVEYH